MTIPLIQQPGPFQQLQATVEAIQQQRQQRQAQALAALAQQTQIQQQQGEIAMQPARREAMEAGTAQTRAETNRAQQTFDREQEDARAVTNAVALVRGARPDAPDYDQRMSAALATLRRPEQIIKFRDAVQAETQAATVAQAAQDAREKAALERQQRVLQRQRLTGLTAMVESDPAYRRLWQELGDPAVAEYRIAQLRAATAGREGNNQAAMAQRQLIIDAINGARTAWQDQMKAYNEGGGRAAYYYYDRDGNLRQHDPRTAPEGAARPMPRESMFRAAAYQQIATDLGITPQAVATLMRQLLIPTTGTPARRR